MNGVFSLIEVIGKLVQIGGIKRVVLWGRKRKEGLDSGCTSLNPSHEPMRDLVAVSVVPQNVCMEKLPVPQDVRPALESGRSNIVEDLQLGVETSHAIPYAVGDAACFAAYGAQ